MTTFRNTTALALAKFTLVVAACTAAASLWAQNRPEEGYLVDARMWHEEVTASATEASHWPTDQWVRLTPREGAIEVSTARAGEIAASDALYFRLPGTTLKAGTRPTYRGDALRKPRFDQDYELSFGKVRFGVRVENVAKGMAYSIRRGEHTYTYVLGPFDAPGTSVLAVADLDGDAQPDFLVQVGDDAVYLLLSTAALPGANLPTAELWAKAD